MFTIELFIGKMRRDLKGEYMMKKKIISFLLLLLVLLSNSLIAFGDEVTTPPNAEDVVSTENLIIPIEGENLEDGIVDMDDVNDAFEKTNEKFQNAEEYVKDKFENSRIDINDVISKNANDELISNSMNDDRIMTRSIGAGNSKILRYDSSMTPELQKYGWWCGPASALNAIDCHSYHTKGKNTRFNQGQMATSLATTTQTSFSNRWEATLNSYMPGNRYSLAWGKNYGSGWAKKLMEGIVCDIDNNFPVIVDVKQNSSLGFLTPSYRNRYNSNGNKSIYHYITVIGYMFKSDGSCDIRYLDSWANNHGANTVSLSELANMSKEIGMVF